MAATAAVAGGLIGIGSPASAATSVPAASEVRYTGGQTTASRQPIRVKVTTYNQSVNGCPSSGPCNLIETYRTVFRVYADHLSVGRSVVVLRDREDGRVVRSWKVNARPGAAGVGGAFTLDTNLSECTGNADAFFQVYDTVSKRWSGKRYVSALCTL
jgi:hypothetical protein